VSEVGGAVESLVRQVLAGRAGALRGVQRLAGGAGNVNFKVSLAGPAAGQVEQWVLTVLFDPHSWWKVDQARLLRAAVGDDPEVLLPRLVEAGQTQWGQQRVAFVLREFVAGDDLDSVLAGGASRGFYDEDWYVVARELGFRLGALHAHRLGGFGLLAEAAGQAAASASWQEFVVQEIARQGALLAAYPPARQIGGCRVGQVAALLPALQRLVAEQSGVLAAVQAPYLAHGDVRLANVIVRCDDDGLWRIKGLIDWEWALAGDPEVDLVCLESWLYSAPYQARFYQVRHNFVAGYALKRAVSAQYGAKRALYHVLRSLSYLGWVFALNPQALLRADARNVGYVERHCRLLHGLAQRQSPEALGIPLIC